MANLGSCSSQLPRKLSEGLMGKGEGRFQSQAGEVTFPSELCVVTQPHRVLVCVSTRSCVWRYSGEVFLVIVKWQHLTPFSAIH